MPNWTEEIFFIKEHKETTPHTYVIEDLEGNKIDGTSYEQAKHQKAKQDVCRIENILKRRGSKVLVKWKRYPDSQNSWIESQLMDLAP